MSDTESVRPSRTSTAPIHSSAIAKLRSIGGRASGLTFAADGTDSANLLDAFSEIFARMAASDAAPQEIDSGFQPEAQRDESVATPVGDDSERTDDHDHESSGFHDRSLDDSIVESAPIVVADAIETESIEIDGVDQTVTFDQDGEPTETAVEVADVEVSDVIVADANPKAIEEAEPVAAVESLVGDQERHKDRGQQNQKIQVPIPTESEGAEPLTNAKQADSGAATTGETQTPSLAAATTEGDAANQEDSGRRSRRGHRDKHEAKPGDPAPAAPPAAASIKRSGTIPIPANLGGSIETLPQQSSTASPPISDLSPKQDLAAAAVQAAAKVASAGASVGRSAPTTGPTTAPNSVVNPGQSATRSPSSIADGTDKKPAAAAKQSQAGDAVNRAKLIQRVSKAFQHLGPDGGHVRLRLAPAELGTVRVEMRMSERRIQARVVAESEAAGAALREHLPELRQRLESQGLQIERFDIDVESQDNEARSSLGQGYSETQQHGQNGNRRSDRSATPDDVSPSVSRNETALNEIGGPVVTVPVGGGVDVRL